VAGKGRAKNSAPVKKKAVKRPLSSHHFPIRESDKVFCARWLEHFDTPRAYKEAGFKGGRKAGTRALAKLERFAEYLRPLREAKSREVAKSLDVEQADVLQTMARKALFNPQDFIERSETPMTRTVRKKDAKSGAEVESEEVLTWEGKPVHATRWKPIHELTREQLATVHVTGSVGGVLQYRLPDPREQHQYLSSMGRQLGMFLEKIIWENHQHRHLHAHLHLDDVPTSKILALTQDLMPLVGPEFAQQLGFTKEEYEEATKVPGGVLMPETGK
jgi:hypothetical protein